MIKNYLLIGDNECKFCKKNEVLENNKYGLCRECADSLDERHYYGDYEDLEKVAVSLYYNDFIRGVIRDYKFNGNTYLRESLSYFLEETLRRNNLLDSIDLIIPIPASKKTLRDRGSNAPGLMAESLAKRLGVDFSDDILIKKHTREQNKISMRERKGNVAGSISLNEDYLSKIKDRKILLVDDIVTTGATLKEGERTLKEYGIDPIKLVLASPSYHAI